MTDSLLQRNAIAVLVIVGAVLILGVTQWRPNWSAYRASMIPAHVAGSGESGRIGDQTWRLDSVRTVDTAGDQVSSLPTGAIGIVVTLNRAGPVADAGCRVVLTDGERRWSSVLTAAPSQPDATTVCGRPGLLELTFDVPAGVRPTAVDIIGGDDAILLRLEI